jgi:acetyl coenzyme A synthetase (ADP forming)-like protein
MSGSTPPPYPADRETDVVLRDGSTVHVRPVRLEDRDAILSFLRGVSSDSIGFRFFAAANLKWAADWAVDVDYDERYGLIAETGHPGRVIAHAAYVRINRQRAEAAFLVDDAWQGRGVSTVLLAHLAEAATMAGIETFVAEVLPFNHRMIQVFRESGFAVELRSTPDAIHVEFPTSLSDEATARFQERDRTAAVAAVTRVLEPRSLAVIGASPRRGTVGGELLYNVIEAGFRGSLYAVNSHGKEAQGIETHRSAADLPEPVDLAVVAVPAAQVLGVARDCVAAGVHAMVVISAGFAETGAEGRQRQHELLKTCRDAGIRLVGPNCLGVLNTSPEVQLDATFAPHQVPAGAIGFLSQSGGLGMAIIEAAARRGIGLSSFVSVGNKADLSGNDLLQYWEQDPATRVVLLYLESFGNPRTFAKIARRVSAVKPVIAVKTGRSPAGVRGTVSHTGALLAVSDVTVDALFHQAGVIRADTIAETIDVATLLSKQPVPKGDRVAIVTNAGGPGIVSADACVAAGVRVPELPPELAARLAAHLPDTASVTNPIDMIATATAEDYRTTLSTLADSDAFDAILAIFVPPLVTRADDVAVAIREVAAVKPQCAIAAAFMTADGPPDELSDDAISVPGFQFPENAARALALATRYGQWRARPVGTVRSAAASAVQHGAATISAELSTGAGWMSAGAVADLLRCHDIPQVDYQLTPADADIVAAARQVGMPVALKAVARGLIHKRDIGAVAVGLDSAEEVRDAAQRIRGSVSAAGFQLEGFLVQAMVPDGVELLLGVVQDPSFGPILACGAGGTQAELQKDVAVRITPVTDSDAAEMLAALRVSALLRGDRGSPPCDLPAVEGILMRVSAMVEAHHEIVELDCNPLIVGAHGATVVDARIRVEHVTPSGPSPSVNG